MVVLVLLVGVDFSLLCFVLFCLLVMIVVVVFCLRGLGFGLDGWWLVGCVV